MPYYTPQISQDPGAKVSINHQSYITVDHPLEMAVVGKTLLSNIERKHNPPPMYRYAANAPTLQVDGSASIGTANPFGKVYAADAPTLHVDGPVSVGVGNPYEMTAFESPHPLLRVKDYVNQVNLRDTLAIIERRAYDWQQPKANPVLWVHGGFIGQTDDADTTLAFGEHAPNTSPKYITIGSSSHPTPDNGAAMTNYSTPWQNINFDKKRKKRLQKKKRLKDMRNFIYSVAQAATGTYLSQHTALSGNPKDRYGLRAQWGNSLAALQLVDAGRPAGKDTVLSWGSTFEDKLRLRFAGRRFKDDSIFIGQDPLANNPGGFDVMVIYPMGVVKILGAIVSYAIGKIK